MMFLLSGEILERYHSTRISSVRGLMRVMPWTGGLFFAGGLALLGMPPFGLFVSEVLLLRAGFTVGRPWVMAFVLLLMLSIFISILRSLNRILYGEPSRELPRGEPGGVRLIPLAVNVVALLMLGLWIPEPAIRLLQQVVEIVHP
jgi:hydrogenase-4 component F